MKRYLNDAQLYWATRFLFAISVFLIVVLSLSYHSINQELVYYSERVDHTHDVLENVQDIRMKLYQVTYFGRGYLIMSDSANRDGMLRKLASIPVKMNYLAELTEDDSVQQVTIDSLKSSFKVYAKLVENFGYSDPSQFDERLKFDLLRNGSSRTENLNSILDQIASVEKELMRERVLNRDNYKQQIFRFNWAIMGVALLFLLSSFLLLERELKRNKHYRAELENQVQNLNRSNAELEQFAYVASHDLQEPLRKIRSFADLLKTKSNKSLTEESHEILEKIMKSAIRMQMLIDDLLSFSRSIDTSREIEEVDLNEILQEVKNTLQSKIEESRAIIRSQRLPVVTGYGNQLAQLFENVIINSIKYCKRDILPVIDISVSENLGSDIMGVRESQADTIFYTVVIRDNGIGFRMEYAEKIFTIFQRLHGQNSYQGSGIGLAICRKVVDNHNGYITADGEEGEGARFYVHLPKTSPTP